MLLPDVVVKNNACKSVSYKIIDDNIKIMLAIVERLCDIPITPNEALSATDGGGGSSASMTTPLGVLVL